MSLTLQAALNYNKAMFNAIYSWLMTEDIRPQIVVDTRVADVVLPSALYGEAMQILSIDMKAAHNLETLDVGLSFNTRFHGQSHLCFIPWQSFVGFVIGRREDGAVETLPAPFMVIAPVNSAPVAANDTVAEDVPVKAEAPPRPEIELPDQAPGDNTVVPLFGRTKK